MSRLILLVEEESMKIFLDRLLPRLFPELEFLTIPHEGKSDLEKSIPRKLRAWQRPDDGFIVLRDQDSADCRVLKEGLRRLCVAAGRADTAVRIVCRELEAWYLGDPEALAQAYADERLRRIAAGRKFRDPDAVVNPARELSALVPEFEKRDGARRLAAVVLPDRNRSKSFQALMAAVEAFLRRRNR